MTKSTITSNEKHGKCSICSRRTVSEGLCEKCFVDKHPLLLKFKEIEILACPCCQRYFKTGKWKDYRDIRTVIMDRVLDSLKYDATVVSDVIIEELTPDLSVKAEAAIKGEAITRIKGRIGGIKVEDRYQIPFKVLMNSCNKCGKKNTQYFEGVFQLRSGSDNNDVFFRAVQFARSVVKKHSTKGIFITKEKIIDGKTTGVDFYLTSQKFIQWLGNRMQEEFGGELKISSQLFSVNKQTSKELYRVNALLRLPEFAKGDVLLIDDYLVRVASISKKITGIDLTRGKKISFEFAKVQPKLLLTEKTTVSSIRPDIEIIHPNYYDSIKVENSDAIKSETLLEKKLAPGDEVNVLLHNSRVWIV